MNRKAIIFGLKGYHLSNAEKKLIKNFKPWGIILFSRNIDSLNQLKNLIKNIKNTIRDKKYPILIDQEGGAVSRLSKIIDLSVFSQSYFGNLYIKDKKLFTNYYKIYVDKVSDICNEVGININTVPNLDIRRKKSHKIVLKRSFSTKPAIVSKLGKICINLYKKNKIATIAKHIPGHGLSKSDSHFFKPIVTAKKKELLKKDFKPFKDCKTFFAMTAHIIYQNFDSKNVATHSSTIIKDIIRGYIKFNGILISDDLSMKSLKCDLQENALRALSAGCNLVLHCNGNFKEMLQLAKVVPKIDNFTKKKTSHFYNFLE